MLKQMEGLQLALESATPSHKEVMPKEQDLEMQCLQEVLPQEPALATQHQWEVQQSELELEMRCPLAVDQEASCRYKLQRVATRASVNQSEEVAELQLELVLETHNHQEVQLLALELEMLKAQVVPLLEPVLEMHNHLEVLLLAQEQETLNQTEEQQQELA